MSNPVWKGALTLGDLSLSVKLFSGPSTETAGLQQIHAGCGGAIGQRQYCKTHNADVLPADIAKSKDGVCLSAEQLEAIAPKKSDTLPLEFTLRSSIDPLYIEGTYYIHPAKADDEKLYTELAHVMTAEQVTAITMLTMQRQRPFWIRPGRDGSLIGHTLFFATEARLLSQFRPFFIAPPDLAASHCPRISAAIATRVVRFDPQSTRDEYLDRLHQLVRTAAETEPAKAKPPASAEAPRPTARKSRKKKADA